MITPGRWSTTRCLTVTGSGHVSAVPDAVLVAVTVQAPGDDPAQALGACGRAQDDVLEALQAAGSQDLRVTGVSVRQEYDHQLQRPGRPVGTARLTCRLPDVTAAGTAVGAALAAGGGAVVLDALVPTVVDRAPLLRQARELAYDDALARAEALARRAGEALGPLLDLAEGSAAGVLQQESGGWRAQAKSASYDLPGAEVDVSAAVTATWALAGGPDDAPGAARP